MATKNQTLEHKLKRLEEISLLLDRGEKAIDEQLELYAEGMKLAEECRVYLQQAELKIRSLSGEMITPIEGK